MMMPPLAVLNQVSKVNGALPPGAKGKKLSGSWTEPKLPLKLKARPTLPSAKLALLKPLLRRP